MGCFINSCQCQPIHPSLILEGQSCVYHSHCVLANSISLLVLVCLVECMCMHNDVCNEVCDGACMTNGVCVVVEGDWWHLWLVAWLCHPHVCLFAIHHKWHSQHIPAFCYTTLIGWQKDLMTCHHALVGCFVTTPFPFPFPTTIVSSSFPNHPFFSRLLLHGCLKMMLGMNLMALVIVLSSFFPYQCLIV